MSSMTRGKFRCSSVMFYGDPEDRDANRQYVFHAVYDTSTPENQRFSAATPWGELKINISNPAVVFEPGKEYYLDFTSVQ